MNGRRAQLPGAAELFRSTRTAQQPAPQQPNGHLVDAPPVEAVPEPDQVPAARKGTGRERHSAKITVYLSDDEVVELERARLSLRAEHGLAVDRGRIVREAVAVLLEDFEDGGAASLLVRRLQAGRAEPR